MSTDWEDAVYGPRTQHQQQQSHESPAFLFERSVQSFPVARRVPPAPVPGLFIDTEYAIPFNRNPWSFFDDLVYLLQKQTCMPEVQRHGRDDFSVTGYMYAREDEVEITFSVYSAKGVFESDIDYVLDVSRAHGDRFVFASFFEHVVRVMTAQEEDLRRRADDTSDLKTEPEVPIDTVWVDDKRGQFDDSGLSPRMPTQEEWDMRIERMEAGPLDSRTECAKNALRAIREHITAYGNMDALVELGVHDRLINIFAETELVAVLRCTAEALTLVCKHAAVRRALTRSDALQERAVGLLNNPPVRIKMLMVTLDLLASAFAGCEGLVEQRARVRDFCKPHAEHYNVHVKLCATRLLLVVDW